ncbi:MAG: lipid-A-disaccharide synthase, partial [Bryobacterales bacterium]|nr:lipid-A-disaccharide synthase [Bryobacterales bacterium]
PLTRMFKPSMSRKEFRASLGIDENRPVVGLLPGSRAGEWKRHLPVLLDAVDRMRQAAPPEQRIPQFILGVPESAMPWPSSGVDGVPGDIDEEKTKKRISAASIKTVVGKTWDLVSHADLLLTASGTVTIEAALAATPMVTFYKVSPWSWKLGRWLVKVPYLTMVNLVAGKRVVPELMQDDATGTALAEAALDLLHDPIAMEKMREDLGRVRHLLASDVDPIERAADAIASMLERGTALAD